MQFLKDHICFLLGGVCILAVGIIFVVSRADSAEVVRDGAAIFDAGAENAGGDAGETAALSPVSAAETEAEIEYIIIHIDGAVNYPGVFSLPATARVDDALTIAGGATDYANLTGINRADFLRDGMKIRIPAEGEDVEEVFVFAAGAETAGAAGILDGLVNINTANSAELQTLPGIGEVRAQSIISFRETHGNFSHIEELMNISGIGPGIMDRVRDRVTVG